MQPGQPDGAFLQHYRQLMPQTGLLSGRCLTGKTGSSISFVHRIILRCINLSFCDPRWIEPVSPVVMLFIRTDNLPFLGTVLAVII